MKGSDSLSQWHVQFCDSVCTAWRSVILSPIMFMFTPHEGQWFSLPSCSCLHHMKVSDSLSQDAHVYTTWRSEIFFPKMLMFTPQEVSDCFSQYIQCCYPVCTAWRSVILSPKSFMFTPHKWKYFFLPRCPMLLTCIHHMECSNYLTWNVPFYITWNVVILSPGMSISTWHEEWWFSFPRCTYLQYFHYV